MLSEQVLLLGEDPLLRIREEGSQRGDIPVVKGMEVLFDLLWDRHFVPVKLVAHQLHKVSVSNTEGFSHLGCSRTNTRLERHVVVEERVTDVLVRAVVVEQCEAISFARFVDTQPADQYHEDSRHFLIFGLYELILNELVCPDFPAHILKLVCPQLPEMEVDILDEFAQFGLMFNLHVFPVLVDAR